MIQNIRLNAQLSRLVDCFTDMAVKWTKKIDRENAQYLNDCDY